MSMFSYLNEIRKRAGLPLLEMTYPEAIEIFKRLGVNAAGMPEKVLKRERAKLALKHHPDRGGSEAITKDINAAFDAIAKAGFERAAQRPSGGPQYGFRGAGYGGPGGGGGGERGAPWNPDPRDSGRIYREDYRDINYIKKTMWEKSGKSKQQWTIWGYDGSFFRGTVTVFGSPKIFNDMAEAMKTWQSEGGNPYPTEAVFASKGNSKKLYVIYAYGKFLGDDPYVLEHESPNANPSNDQSFMRSLNHYLDKIVSDSVMGDVEGAPNKASASKKKKAASAYAAMGGGERPSKSYGKA